MVEKKNLVRMLSAFSIWKWFFLGCIFSLPFLSVPIPSPAFGSGAIQPPQLAVASAVIVVYLGLFLVAATGRSIHLRPADRSFISSVFVCVLVFTVELLHAYQGTGLYALSTILTARLFSLSCLLIAIPVLRFRDDDFQLLMKVFFAAGLVSSVVILTSSGGLFEAFSRLSNPLPFRVDGGIVRRSLGFLRGSGNNAIIFAFALAAWLYLVSERAGHWVLRLLCGIPLLAGIVFTGSRNVWITAIITLLLFHISLLPASNRKPRLAPPIKWATGLFGAGFALILTWHWLYEVRPRSVELRLDQHRVVLGEFARHFVVGLGPGAIEVGGHLLHNSFLLLMASTGLVGVVFVVLVLFHLGRVLSHRFQSRAVGTLAVGCVSMVIAASFYPASAEGNPIFWIPLALLFVTSGLARTVERPVCG